DGTTEERRRPVKIMDDAAYVAGGSSHAAAIKNDGSLWIWGSNRYGQFGDGTTESQSSPKKIMDGVASVAVGHYHTLVVKTDGSLWACGLNNSGQIGNGAIGTTENPVSSPVRIMDSVSAASAGQSHSMALKKDGSLWAWGNNSCGQLGDGTAESSSAPLKIMEGIAAISAGSETSLAVKTDGSLWAWGEGRAGQLGDGSYGRAKVNPVKVMEDAVSAASGSNHCLALKTDGSIWAWGYNQYGQVGNGKSSMNGELSPVDISFGPTAAAPADIRITIDGKPISLDLAPVIQNDRTLIPIRPVAEAIGADVDWDQTTKTATLVRAGVTVELTIGSTAAQVDGESVPLDAAPMILNGRTLLPVRFVAETFSQDVKWDAQNRVVVIVEDMDFAKDSNLKEWLIGVGAIIAKVNERVGADPYFMGIYERTSSGVRTARSVLKNSWGTESREDLLDAIYGIANFGHSHNFDQDAALFKSFSTAEQKQIMKNATGVDAYMWPYVMELDKKWGDKSIRAWDWFRVGHLCRWGYAAGYITLEEAYAIFEPTAKELRSTFKSWDEATENYLDGYAYWGRIDVSKTPNEFTRRTQMYEAMKVQEKNDPRGLLFDPKVWSEPVKGA
ncbi:MAG: stalk domain-containing protein, partial [Clostridiales bacterium]|nr:stalk domain-containing protein [Clostridiales bacterium]